MWHLLLFTRTNVTEMAKWSTTGFPLQCQSLISRTSDENYGNHQLEDTFLMYEQILRTLMSREMKDSEGELTVWTQQWKWWRIGSLHTPLQGLKKNLNSSLPFGQSVLKFCLPWASLGLFISLFSWRTTCLGTCPLSEWEWKVTYPIAKSTCPRHLSSTFFKPSSSH